MATAEGRKPRIESPAIGPVGWKMHTVPGYATVLEVWARAGALQPFYYAVQDEESYPKTTPVLAFGSRGEVPPGPSRVAQERTVFRSNKVFPEEDTLWSGEVRGTPPVTPATCVYVFCPTLPSRIIVGEDGGHSVTITMNR